MDDSIFARLGYDPVRIHAHFHGQPAPGGIARLGSPATAVEVKGDCPEPASEASAVPPQDGEGDHLKGGGGAPAGDPDLAGSEQPLVPLHHPADGPPPRAGEELDDPPRSGEEPDRIPIMRAWLNEHWDLVDAMARAGEAPVRPVPPAPSPAPLDRADMPRPYVARGDRWNKWKMAEFLRQLAVTHSVTAAARAVGLSRNSAYKLRAAQGPAVRHRLGR